MRRGVDVPLVADILFSAEAALAAAEFLLEHLCDSRGRLLHYWRRGRAKQNAFLDDYAGLANALVTLYESTSQRRWLDEAIRLADDILARFADPQEGGFFYTPVDHEPLVARKKELGDTSVPSSTGLAVTALIRLAQWTGRDDYRRAAEEMLSRCAGIMEQIPTMTGQLLLALDMLLHAR
jgi:uncharacterized protein